MDRTRTVSNVTLLRPRDPPRKVRTESAGIEVGEGQLGLIKAQRIYRMRCECGRPWFELDLPKLAECPSCGNKGVVFI